MQSVLPHNQDSLIRRIAEGDEQAFREIYDLHRDRVYTYSMAIIKVRSLAEDTVQEVFLKIWTNKAKLPQIQNFTAYLTTITRNHIISQFRKMASEESFIRALIRQGELQIAKPHSEAMLYSELKMVLAQAVNRLSPRQKQIYELSRLEGYSYEEIAGMLNLSPQTVKTHMKIALRSIRDWLQKHESRIVLVIYLLMEK